MRIAFEGECTVERCDELSKSLLEALDSGKDVELSLAKVTSADLSLFLLLHSALASWKQAGGTLTIVSDLPEHLVAKAACAGLGHLSRSEAA